jgi:hypothetical protein
MLFSTRARALIKEGENKFVIKTVECVDMQTDTIYIKNENEANLISVPDKKEPVLKQVAIRADDLNVENCDENNKFLYTGDIVNITRGRVNNNYEIVIMNGEVKGREIKSLMIVDIKRLLEDDRTNKSLTKLHRDINGHLVEIQE